MFHPGVSHSGVFSPIHRGKGNGILIVNPTSVTLGGLKGKLAVVASAIPSLTIESPVNWAMVPLQHKIKLNCRLVVPSSFFTVYPTAQG